MPGRDDVTRAAAEAFRTKVIAAKETGSQPPVRLMDNTSFVYVKHSDIFVVAMTRSNANAGAWRPGCRAVAALAAPWRRGGAPAAGEPASI